jgi:ABC-type uncharacterized transport system substrate-binding protein
MPARRCVPCYDRCMSAFRILSALAVLGLAVPASAHPHVWVKVKSELIYAADGSVTAVRQHWTFDDMFSAFAVQGLSAKVNGALTREELAPAAKQNMQSLKDSGYFTFATADGQKLDFGAPLPDYWLDDEDAILTLNFTVPFKHPVKAKSLTVEIYDPTYFIDFEFAKGMPVKLIGVPKECTGQVEWPRQLTYAEGKMLSNNPEAAANWGTNFPNKIMVKCP